MPLWAGHEVIKALSVSQGIYLILEVDQLIQYAI